MAPYRNARIFAALLTLGSSALSAQDSIPLGTRVRVSAGTGSDSRPIVGTLTRADTAAWVLRLNERGDSVVVPTADLTEIRVSRGTRRHVLPGIAIGALLGGVVGSATYQGRGGSSPPTCQPASFCADWGYPLSGFPDPLATEVGRIVIGAWAGSMVGGALGALVKTDRWKLVNREAVHVAIRPSGAGLGVGVSLRF